MHDLFGPAVVPDDTTAVVADDDLFGAEVGPEDTTAVVYDDTELDMVSASVRATAGKQARPSITHKLEVLATVEQLCKPGRPMPSKHDMKKLALAHSSCCGSLTPAKIQAWRSAESNWKDMPAEVKAVHYRMPNAMRVAQGLNKIGSAGALAASDPVLQELVKSVVSKAEESAAAGRRPSIVDVTIQLRFEKDLSSIPLSSSARAEFEGKVVYLCCRLYGIL